MCPVFLCVLMLTHRSADYSKLPPSPPVDSVFLLDPLIGKSRLSVKILSYLIVSQQRVELRVRR